MIQPVLQPQQPPQRTILTVSQLNRQAKQCLETNIGSVWLTGEISNLVKARSGHWYFSLKDEDAQIRCAMFRFKVQNLHFSAEEGAQVVVKGKLSLYEARGDYQLLCDYMEPAGEGNLQQKLRALMQKLQAQGLFDENRKVPLPFLPRQIGVITSPTGAAIHDVLNVLKRRCPQVPVIIYPTQVQGAQAANDIIAALDLAESRRECDVLLITRGGGSLEDLWCFNDERLAHRVAALTIPTVAAIGHEVDITITELVADLRAPTPSAAAELLVPEQQALQQKIDLLSLSMTALLTSQIKERQSRLNIARLTLSDPSAAIAASVHRLDRRRQNLESAVAASYAAKQRRLDKLTSQLQRQNPINQLQLNIQQLKNLSVRLNKSGEAKIRQMEHRLKVQVNALNTLSPLSTLSRGYSIIRDDKGEKVINSVAGLEEKQRVDILLSDGSALATIEKVIPKPQK